MSQFMECKNGADRRLFCSGLIRFMCLAFSKNSSSLIWVASNARVVILLWNTKAFVRESMLGNGNPVCFPPFKSKENRR